MAEPQKAAWMVSARMIVSIIASMVVIFSGLIGVTSACISLYFGLATRVTVLETNTQNMGNDVKDIKAMLSQLMMNRADNRPETRGWTK